MDESTNPYLRLRSIARRRDHGGHFTTAEAVAAGMARYQLRLLVARGTLTPVSRGLFRFTVAPAPSWTQQLAGEVLRTSGLACSVTSVALYGLAEPPRNGFDLLVPRGSRYRGPGMHSTRTLATWERTTVGGVASLAPVRAVLHAADRLRGDALVSLVESAVVRGLVQPEDLDHRARELSNAKRPGCGRVRGVLRALHPELETAYNEWEALVVRRVRQAGLPAPALQHEIVLDGRRYFLDAAWPEVLVALEFDGRDPHMRRQVHDNDSVRRNDLEDAGWKHYTITSTELASPAGRTLAQVAKAIALRTSR